MSNEVIELPQVQQNQSEPKTDLSVVLTDKAIEAMSIQRKQLNEFIKGQLREDVDFGKIPGCPKPSLLKPGAEKLANLFKLGSRIINIEKTIEREPPGFAMFTYTVEVFHIPSGKSISQCQGSANSEEKKYKKVALGDLLNTLQKMAQKRAYVGALIIAVGASDFFTQDIEDLPKEMVGGDASDEDGMLNENYVLKYGRAKGKTLGTASVESLKSFIAWFEKNNITAPAVIAEKEIVQAYLKMPEQFKVK